MSGYTYTLEEQENLAIHLTNNAIQKHDPNYGQKESGNILSYKQAQVSLTLSLSQLYWLCVDVSM